MVERAAADDSRLVRVDVRLLPVLPDEGLQRVEIAPDHNDGEVVGRLGARQAEMDRLDPVLRGHERHRGVEEELAERRALLGIDAHAEDADDHGFPPFLAGT